MSVHVSFKLESKDSVMDNDSELCIEDPSSKSRCSRYIDSRANKLVKGSNPPILFELWVN